MKVEFTRKMWSNIAIILASTSQLFCIVMWHCQILLKIKVMQFNKITGKISGKNPFSIDLCLELSSTCGKIWIKGALHIESLQQKVFGFLIWNMSQSFGIFNKILPIISTYNVNVLRKYIHFYNIFTSVKKNSIQHKNATNVTKKLCWIICEHDLKCTIQITDKKL